VGLKIVSGFHFLYFLEYVCKGILIRVSCFTSRLSFQALIRIEARILFVVTFGVLCNEFDTLESYLGMIMAEL
jgi:hypothetical protein